VYRAALDSLHDIDMTIPYNVHEQTPFSFWNKSVVDRYNKETEPFWEVKKEDRDEKWKEELAKINDKYTEERLNYLLTTPFF
jgi:hypothetical protein